MPIAIGWSIGKKISTSTQTRTENGGLEIPCYIPLTMEAKTTLDITAESGGVNKKIDNLSPGAIGLSG